jgi:hypothetical protein
MKLDSGKRCTWRDRYYENWTAKDQMPTSRIIREIKGNLTDNGGVDIHGYVS